MVRGKVNRNGLGTIPTPQLFIANLNVKNVKIQTFAVMGQSSKLISQNLVSRLASSRLEAVRT